MDIWFGKFFGWLMIGAIVAGALLGIAGIVTALTHVTPIRHDENWLGISVTRIGVACGIVGLFVKAHPFESRADDLFTLKDGWPVYLTAAIGAVFTAMVS